jgi:hypothetical protein
MKTALFTSEKEADLQLLLELANRLGIKTRLLDEEEMEDLGLVHVETGKTGEFVNTEDYLKKLRS